MVRIATPHQTNARRCVTVRAIKSLIRMSEPPFNTNRREDANAAAVIDPAAFPLAWRGELLEPDWSRRALAPQSHGPRADRLHVQCYLRYSRRCCSVRCPQRKTRFKVINTELQPGEYRAKGIFSRLNDFSRCVCSIKPLKRLGYSIRAFTGLKAGVN